MTSPLSQRVLLMVGALLAACAVPAWAGDRNPELRIHLLPRADVSQEPVRLQDLAQVSASDESMAMAVRQLVLGDPPVAGQSAFLTREAIARWVSLQTGVRASSIAWSGAEFTRVVTTAALSARVPVVGAARAEKAQTAPSARASSDGAPANAVVRGQVVVLEMLEGAIELQAQARAMEDGRLGQRIAVRTAAAQLTGEVVGNARVRLAP